MQGEWIRNGSVSVVQGSTIVTGILTAWQYSGAVVGDFFIGPDEEMYEITGVYKIGEGIVGNLAHERLTIQNIGGIGGYQGETVTSGPYCIIRNWSNTTNAVLAARIAELLKVGTVAGAIDGKIKLVPSSPFFMFDRSGFPNPAEQIITFIAFMQEPTGGEFVFTTSPSIRSQESESNIFRLNLTDMGIYDAVKVTVTQASITDSVTIYYSKWDSTLAPPTVSDFDFHYERNIGLLRGTVLGLPTVSIGDCLVLSPPPNVISESNYEVMALPTLTYTTMVI